MPEALKTESGPVVVDPPANSFDVRIHHSHLEWIWYMLGDPHGTFHQYSQSIISDLLGPIDNLFLDSPYMVSIPYPVSGLFYQQGTGSGLGYMMTDGLPTTPFHMVCIVEDHEDHFSIRITPFLTYQPFEPTNNVIDCSIYEYMEWCDKICQICDENEADLQLIQGCSF